MADINLVSILSLALVDAVNPCALAVMTIVLITLLTQNPEKEKAALKGGLAFTFAVFLLYLIYGIVMVQFFSHIIPNTGSFAGYVFKGFGVFAIILGILNFKDYLDYKPGGFMTEMPMKIRPIMKSIVKRITSIKGAFVIGLIVTLFLLPCTIGPYIIASGKLSALQFVQTIPWLLVYNLIFILPMIAITLIIYFGLKTINDISGWKDKNIKYLHLIEGLILAILGILMVTGLI